MSGETKLDEFLSSVDNWIACHDLPHFEPNENINSILNMRSGELSELNNQEKLEKAYELYSYSEYLEGLKAKESVVLEWAEGSIWFIVSTVIDQYGDGYTKWEKKYYSAIKENPLASEILKIKNHAQARITLIGKQYETVRRMAEILNNMSRQNWRG